MLYYNILSHHVAISTYGQMTHLNVTSASELSLQGLSRHNRNLYTLHKQKKTDEKTTINLALCNGYPGY